MTALLAMMSSLIIGGSDFLLGLGSRESAPQRIPISANVSSAATLLLLSLVIPAVAVDRTSILAGISFGLTGAVGFTLYLMALRIGKMSLVAPMTALASSLCLIAIGVAGGDRPTLLVAAGIALAVLAGVLISQGPESENGSDDRRALVYALAAGVVFSLFFWGLSFINPDSGVWPFVVGRAAAIVVQLLIALAATGGWRVPRSTLRFTLPAGALEALAVLFAAAAMRRGPVSVAGVLSSLYPISTVLLAWLLLHERLSPQQRLAVGVAVVAVPLTGL